MLEVLVADLDGILVVVEVILAVGQAEASLPRIHHVDLGVLEVRVLAERKRHVDATLDRTGEIDGEIVAVFDGGDTIQLGL